MRTGMPESSSTQTQTAVPPTKSPSGTLHPPVEHHAAHGLQGEQILRPDLGDIHGVEVVAVGALQRIGKTGAACEVRVGSVAHLWGHSRWIAAGGLQHRVGRLKARARRHSAQGRKTDLLAASAHSRLL